MLSPCAPAWAAADKNSVRLSPVALNDALQVGAGLVLVLVLIALGAWLLKRFARVSTSGARGKLRIVCGLGLGAREKVVLMQVGRTQLLLGVSPGRIQTLHVLEHPLEELPEACVAAPPFAQHLGSLLGVRRRSQNAAHGPQDPPGGTGTS